MEVNVLESCKFPQRFLVEFLVLHSRVLVEDLHVEGNVLPQPRMKSKFMELDSLDRV